MNDWLEKIDRLDLSLFKAIPSQTSAEDRRSLLAVQRATARKHKEYVYLEIGSHLGGSIQPHLVDDRCKKIYSVDPRPSQQADDRPSMRVVCYNNNSAQRMIGLLSEIDHDKVAKIECFDLDASEVDPEKIKTSPQLIFIDGAHTRSAVLSDFLFCSKVVDREGTILFHDFFTINSAIIDICRSLERQNHSYVALKLEGSVFAIFFDLDKILSDQYLADLYKRNKHFLKLFRLKQWLKRILPAPLIGAVKCMRNLSGKRNAAE